MNDQSRVPRIALEIILEWSEDRPQWQRDALRRVVQQSSISDQDIEELTELCKQGKMA